MNIIISATSSDPIYEQIIIQIKAMIAQEELKADTLLPSMRQLAKDLKVSVITTKRAYEELEREGFIYTVPSKGSYVSKRDETMIQDYYESKITDSLLEAIELSKTASLSKDDLMNILSTLWKEED